MSDFVTAMTGAGLTVAVGLTAIARSVRPTGRHRAPRPTAETALLRPSEALDQFEAYCPAEDRRTLQLRLRLGGVRCTECHNDPVEAAQ
ncbi:hypothetical protein [Streptomyces sp. ME01-18h]|uniref:hypothetical protein n=1 Tax=Streptomyces sp. ME01-18h TaxID=462920 RepID=UPI0029BC728A|nr:hypothetical protein [Streptomyces sp. ME01-18h]MDX3398399.1 hypothetical protein [Streptomyces sp. ME01-18h]